MLSARELTVGTLADAKPLSLMLPRTQYETAALIGQLDTQVTAILLEGNHIFHSFECSTAANWPGLLIPDIRIEIDETSVFDPRSVFPQLGALERIDTRLTINSIPEGSLGRRSKVVLEANLMSTTHDLTAGFSRWSVVLGEGQNKHTLRTIDASQTK